MFGMFELLLLMLVLGALSITGFCLALVVFFKVRRIERNSGKELPPS